jgi:Lon protease-like protein
MILPLHIFEERYRRLMARRLDADPIFGVVLTRRGREVGDRPDIHDVGAAASLLRAVRHPDGRYDIAVRGERRFRVRDGHWDEGYLTGTIDWLEEAETDTGADVPPLLRQVKSAFDDYLALLETTLGTRLERLDPGDDARTLGYAISAAMPFDVAQRQRLLAAPTTADRLAELLAALRRERDLLRAAGIGGAAIEHPGRRFFVN